MFSYLKIVFGLKLQYRISDVVKLIKQQRCCSILISQHNALDVDDCCDRPDVHFHGVVECSYDNKDKNILKQLMSYCIYLNNDHCSNPVEYLAYITIPPKRIVAREFLEFSKLLGQLQTASNMQLEPLRRRRERKLWHIQRNNKVVQIVDSLLKSGYSGNAYNVKKNGPSWARFQKLASFGDGILETALNVSQKIVLNSPILVLSNRFELLDGYLTPKESAQFVLDWCSYQNIDPRIFVENLIRCLDKRGGDLNSIYLHGSGNSGKTYIVQSIVEACIYVGEVIVESSAYTFVWGKCVDKRLIVLKEPHFSMLNFDQLDKILSGSGTLVYKHNDLVDYLPPTPVIILANAHDWLDDPELSENIKKRFLSCYTNLKYFPIASEKKLHPRWLNLLHETLCQNGSSIEKESNTSCGSYLKCNSRKDNGMEIRTKEHFKNGRNWSDSPKTSGENDLLATIISMDTHGSENVKPPNLKCRKRPMRDEFEIGQYGGRSKMMRAEAIQEE